MKEIITFFGAEPKVGTTMIAQSFAEELVARKKKCLLIFASSNMFDEYLKKDDSSVSLDNLLNIDPDNLKKGDVQRVITSSGGLHHIKGSTRPLQIRYFSEKLIPKITELAEYEYIVIDGGSNYHFPLPVSSILAATKTFYVLTQDAKAINRFTATNSLILKSPALTNDSEKAIVINKFSKKSGVYTDQIIKDMFGYDVYPVSRVMGGETCEANQTTLYKTNKTFRANIVELVNSVLGGGSNV